MRTDGDRKKRIAERANVFLSCQQREDINLILKLQHKLKTLEFEKDKLTEQIDLNERFISRSKFSDRTKDSIRVSLPQVGDLIVYDSILYLPLIAASRTRNRKR
jgi:hypothetical protein